MHKETGKQAGLAWIGLADIQISEWIANTHLNVCCVL